MRLWSHQGYEESTRKNRTVIFPAKETAIKFIAGSQQRNSCKRVPLCASALRSGERTVADRMRPRPHLSPENVVYSCPWPLASLTRGCESQRCTSGSIHDTDTRESAPFRPAFTPAPSQSPQRQAAVPVTRARHSPHAFCLQGGSSSLWSSAVPPPSTPQDHIQVGAATAAGDWWPTRWPIFP